MHVVHSVGFRKVLVLGRHTLYILFSVNSRFTDFCKESPDLPNDLNRAECLSTGDAISTSHHRFGKQVSSCSTLSQNEMT